MAIVNGNWDRPSDWLEMPTIGTQEFIGLLAITDDESNHIALTCQGAYTVDWGDGVIENVATNVKAQHTYTYSAISSDTLSTRGYKQVLVRVTPQAGQNLTKVDLNQQNSILAKAHTVGWLDIAINGSNITTLSINGGSVVGLHMCERVIIGNTGAINSFSQLFYFMYALQYVSISGGASVLSFSNMFTSCFMLTNVYITNSSLVTNFSNMFENCKSLKTAPSINTSAGNNFNSMFNGCTSLETVPLLNTTSGTTFGSMFSGCASLKTIQQLNTSAGTVFNNMFAGCGSLKSIPLINTSNGSNFSSMFNGCGVDTIPLLNTSKGTNFSSMFYYSRITTIPLIDTSKGTNFNSMFYGCYYLTTIPLIDTSKGADFRYMFPYSLSLKSLPNLNTALGTTFTQIVDGCPSLTKGAFQGTRYSIGYPNMCLSRNAVVDIFNGLGTAVGTQTITITSNPAFSAIPLNVSPGASWRGVTIQSSSQDVYAVNSSTGTNGVYKQTGGVGAFVLESLASNAFYRGMGTDIYGNIYLATQLGNATDLLKKTGGVGSWATISTTGLSGGSVQVSGDFLGNLYVGTSVGLYKQTALTGSFVQVFAGNIISLSISPFDGSIYVIIGSVIYKQTAGTGTFDAVQTISSIGGLCCMPNGDVYASNGTLHKQTAGTGSFVSMGISAGIYGIVNKSDGNLYVLSTDVTYLDFNKVVTPTDRLIATSKGWTIA